MISLYHMSPLLVTQDTSEIDFASFQGSKPTQDHLRLHILLLGCLILKDRPLPCRIDPDILILAVNQRLLLLHHILSELWFLHTLTIVLLTPESLPGHYILD